MKIKILSILIIVAIFAACTPQLNMLYQRSGMVKCESHDKMTITLVSEAQAETLGKAIGFAERNAIENLLFKGIPNSNQEKPMIENESKAMNENGAFLDNFLVNNGYKNYITSSTIDDVMQGGSVRLVSQRVIVDITNLRKHLEANSIVKKFGLY